MLVEDGCELNFESFGKAFALYRKREWAPPFGVILALGSR